MTDREFLDVDDLRFGDYIVFRHHCENRGWGPIETGIYIGWEACDQTVGMIYCPWQHHRNESEFDLRSHVQWRGATYIYGHWKSRPTWRQLLQAYRTGDGGTG